MSEDDPYLYPGTPVLRNRLGLTDPDQLDKVERRLVAQRIAEGAPRGGFDLAHLRANAARAQRLVEWFHP